jgi:hypothetical protein
MNYLRRLYWSVVVWFLARKYRAQAEKAIAEEAARLELQWREIREESDEASSNH